MTHLKLPLFVFLRCYSSLPHCVRVRFAPSPTGFMHLGGLRTAFYNYLYARKNKGKFILRIEDTDRKRIVPGSIENLYSTLEWSGLIPDESSKIGGDFGPYMQSQRLNLYQEKAEQLLETGAAYRCFCSEDRLTILRKEAQRTRQIQRYDNKCRHLEKDEVEELLAKNTPFAIRFKIPQGTVSHEDIVFGQYSYDLSKNEGDFVIMKSDGFPTYHFACVVDDHLMQISHVLRGSEWLISTPKHILLHQALGFQPPRFAHLPLLVNSDRTKLSKRQESIGIEYFKNKGYSPAAVVNFLAAAGGGFGPHEGFHIFSLDTLISKFNLEDVNTNSCVVDLPKLDHFNHNHLAKCISNVDSMSTLIKELRILLREKYGDRYSEEEKNLPDSYMEKILLVYKDRMHTLNNLVQPDMDFLWTFNHPDKVLQKLHIMKIPDTAVSNLKSISSLLALVPESEFTESDLSPKLESISETVNMKRVTFMRLLRIVLTNQKDGPKINEILTFLGKRRSLDKINCIVERHNDKDNITFQTSQ